jgi:MPBQ/MSBQ methyltransferase
MRFIQHKREAFWFYRVLSPLYDRWVNPMFWTPAMRSAALELARLGDEDLRLLDVGAGTGFSTEGIVEHVDAASVTLLDQSPDQLRRAGRKPALARCTRVLGDAEQLPFETDSFDRYVSCGSIEYWPEPQRAIAEAYRVLRPGGIGLVVGPLPPGVPIVRWLADAWMLFPTEAQYREWFVRAGFEIVATTHVKAPWQGERGAPYGLAIAGCKPLAGTSPLDPLPPVEELREPLTLAGRVGFAARLTLGSVAASMFLPIGAALNLRARRAHRRS